MSRTGKYRKLLLLGGSCAIIGPLSMTFWNRGQTPEWVYWLTMPFAGCSFGTIFCVTLTALMASLSKSEMASATGMNFLFRSTGSVMGISLSGLILQSSLKVHLEQTSLPTKVSSHRQWAVWKLMVLGPKVQSWRARGAKMINLREEVSSEPWAQVG